MSARELSKPDEIRGDDQATEMIRAWIAHDDLHVALLLGMWADADEADIDEREAWGELLADVVRHIAHGLNQSHGWDELQTRSRIRAALVDHLENATGTMDGGYPDN